MKRPLIVWLVFAACALTGLAVLGWFSSEMMRLERGATQAREIAAREENVRLALWRMDSALASVHGLEAARSPADYTPFLRSLATFAADLTPISSDGVMLPSPLLGYTPPFVRLHLEIAQDGRITSPQVPEGTAYLAALRAGTPSGEIEAASTRLQQLRSNVPYTVFTSAFEMPEPIERHDERSQASAFASERKLAFDAVQDVAPAAASTQQIAPQAERQAVEEFRKSRAEQQQRTDLVEGNYYTMNAAPQQRARSSDLRRKLADDAILPEAAKVGGNQTLDAEMMVAFEGYSGSSAAQAKQADDVRAELDKPLSFSEGATAFTESGIPGAGSSVPGPSPGVPGRLAAPRNIDEVRPAAAVAAAPTARPFSGQFAVPTAKAEPPSEEPQEFSAGPIQALWAGDDLFFVRRVDGNGRARVQAVWLDWPELRAWLLGRVTDLLPDAVLDPVPADSGFTVDDSSRRLAFLPVRLRPGAVPLPISSLQSPLRTSLAIAWALAGVGIVALALLLAGTLRLSERRGAFVSAVTHELRTPLTTFRMYTEMLSSGMVPDEAKRRSYIDTLRKEAERLSHLVENVLSYARLERGRASQRIEDTTPGALLERIEERLRLRAEQGGLTLGLAFAPGAADLPLHTDTTAFEQIIFNLVDNAAKYARRADGGGQLSISVAGGPRGRLIVRVSDNGPGIAASVRRRLFQPFSKSAAEAAHSQPGVGLGLALSRRLARDELHGELSLERSGPEGTVFRLEV